MLRCAPRAGFAIGPACRPMYDWARTGTDRVDCAIGPDALASLAPDGTERGGLHDQRDALASLARNGAGRAGWLARLRCGHVVVAWVGCLWAGEPDGDSGIAAGLEPVPRSLHDVVGD